jgi:cell division protein FtsQ
MSDSKPKTFHVLFLIALVICLAFGANAWKSNLRINQIIINGNRIVNTNEIIQLTQVPMGTLLYKANLTAIQRNVMSHYYIKDAVVERNLPNSINIQITERIPIAMVNLSEPLYLDEDGVVLPKTVSYKIFDLPMISGISASEISIVGSTITRPDEIEALQLLAVLKTVNRPLYHNISEIQVRNGGDIVLYSAEGGVPIIFGRGDLPEKLIRLEIFWNDIVRTRGVQYLHYVDLRYQDQIVARWNQEPVSTKSL